MRRGWWGWRRGRTPAPSSFVPPGMVVEVVVVVRGMLALVAYGGW
jgi:hypothetical protein